MNEITNADRASWALEALTGFVKTTQTDTAHEAISDMIVDLLHLARGRGLDTQLMLQQAHGLMAEEARDDLEGDMAEVQVQFATLLSSDR